jgi:hypothetical protein
LQQDNRPSTASDDLYFSWIFFGFCGSHLNLSKDAATPRQRQVKSQRFSYDTPSAIMNLCRNGGESSQSVTDKFDEGRAR